MDTSTTDTPTSTLASVVEELEAWPDELTVNLSGLAARLRPLIGEEGLDVQQVAWALSIDGRYGGDPLSPELDERYCRPGWPRTALTAVGVVARPLRQITAWLGDLESSIRRNRWKEVGK